MADFLDPKGEIQKHGSDLPHWQQGEAMQFVTFRLRDSMPANKLKTWQEQHQAWLALNPKPWAPETLRTYHRCFTSKLENWLDQGAGSCLLQDPSNRQILEDALMRFQGEKVVHHAWVIMPNHVHLLFSPRQPIDKLIQAWKCVSARHIACGSIWQKNYRDTLIRDATHFAKAVRYIRRNPSKLLAHSFSLWQGPLAEAVF